MKLLWLDDIRDPQDNIWWNWIAKEGINPLKFEIFWIKDYHQFVDWINENGIPDVICFDHDLSDIHCNKSTYKEKTGFTCAQFLVDYCIENELKIPQYKIQSANPVGAQNIAGLLENAIKHLSL
jgi:hypothetical protein